MDQLYASITGCTQSNILSITVNESHGSATANAVFEVIDTTLDIGDYVEINLGYTTDHGVVFAGYVKQIEHKIQENTYSITANDILIRASDYFIVPSNPDDSFKRRGISAEDPVREVMAMAGLTSFTYDATYFTFGINSDVEVKLVSSYDYSRMIGDYITWTVRADRNGTVHFENRKPYVMTGSTGQPGDVPDVPTSYTIQDSNLISFSKFVNEKNLRNKVVVWGADGVYAEASASSPYLPAGFYKTVLLSAPDLIGDVGTAQACANYNLNLLNRLTEGISATVLGDHSLTARTVIKSNVVSITPHITNNWYVFTAEHNWNRSGYTTNLELRK